MTLCNVHVQMVPGGKCLWTVFTLISERPWKVNVFNMIPQVTPIRANFATQCASVSLRASLWVSDYVLIQLLHVSSCNSREVTVAVRTVLFKAYTWHRFMGVSHMVVQVVLGCESLRTILACIGKGSGEVDIFNMLSQICFVVTDFTTNCTFVSLGTSFRMFDYVIIQLPVPTCKQSSHMEQDLVNPVVL